MEQAWDNSSMGREKSHEPKGGHQRGTDKQQSSHCFIMDLCHLKNSELEPQFQKYKGRVVLRGDIVKDDSGSYAVFTEQGLSASQMTAAKVMDVLARLPDCDGFCLHPSKIGGRSQIAQNSKIRMSRRMDTSSTTHMAEILGKHWRSCGTSWTKLIRTPIRRTLVGRQFGEAMMELGREKGPNWECLFVHRKQKLFLSVYVDDTKMSGKKQKLAPMWRKMMKNVDIEGPTSFLDHVCTRRECTPNEKIIGHYNKMFESRISAGANEKLSGWDQLRAKLQRGPTMWKDMLGNAWNGLANWRTRRQSNFSRFPVLVWTITKLKRKAWKTKVNCQKFAPILYLNACTLHELVDLTICGPPKNWHDLSQNGLKHVTDDWHD